MKPHKVSDCCGASPKNDIEEEICLCSECGEHCEYVEEETLDCLFEDDYGDRAWCHDPDMGAKG